MGGTIEIRLNTSEGPVIARAEIPQGNEWITVITPVTGTKKDVQNLVVISVENKPVEFDWIHFE